RSATTHFSRHKSFSADACYPFARRASLVGGSVVYCANFMRNWALDSDGPTSSGIIFAAVRAPVCADPRSRRLISSATRPLARALLKAHLESSNARGATMAKQLKIDVFTDVVCPWCLVGSVRLDSAIAA